MTTPILVGTDGSRKMSKSLGNHIGITDSRGEMFGKAMSIRDAAIGEYFWLLLESRLGTGAALTEEDLQGRAARDTKRRLARALVAWLHSEQAAEEAEREWDRVFAVARYRRRSRTRCCRPGRRFICRR
jgi:tyrosyl-tRNA synthetase